MPRVASGKTNTHAISWQIQQSAPAEKKCMLDYLQKCLVYLCMAELAHEECTFLFF